MTFTTPRFGPITIPDQDVIHFPDGITPFASRRYALVTREGEEPFAWLQSLDDPALAFVVAPMQLFAEPSDIPEGQLVLCLIVVGETPEQCTVNLLAPLVIDPATGVGRQVVLEGDVGRVRGRVTAGKREEDRGKREDNEAARP